MADIFISHSNKDETIVREIAGSLEKEGFTTWYYERDSVALAHQLEQEAQVIKECRAIIVLVSQHSTDSDEVNDELILTRSFRKPILPVFHNIDHPGLKQRKPEWLLIFGDTVAVQILPEGVLPVIPRIVDGLKKAGIQPKKKTSQLQTIIAVMGSKGGVGKSTVIAAMAELIASTGHNVMIIDADIQSAGIMKLLGPRALERPHVWSVKDAAYAKGGRLSTGQYTDTGAWDVTPKYLRDERFGRIYLIPGKRDNDERPGYEALADISPDRRNEMALGVLQDTMDRAKQLPSRIDCILIDSGAENNPLVSAGFVLGTYGFIVCGPRTDSYKEVSDLQSMHEQRYPNNKVITMKIIVNQAVLGTETLWAGKPDVCFVREDPSMRLASALTGEFDFQGVGLNWFYLDVLRVLKTNTSSAPHSKLLPDETEVWVKPYLKDMKDFPEIMLRKLSFRFVWPITLVVIFLVLAVIAGSGVAFIRSGQQTSKVITTRDIVRPNTEADADFNANITQVRFPAGFENRVWLEGKVLNIKGTISQTELTKLKAATDYEPVRNALIEGAVLSDKAVKDAAQKATSTRSTGMVAGTLAIIVAGIRIVRHNTLRKRKGLVQDLVKARNTASERDFTKFIHELIEKEPAKPQLRWLRDEFRRYEAKRVVDTIGKLFQ